MSNVVEPSESRKRTTSVLLLTHSQQQVWFHRHSHSHVITQITWRVFFFPFKTQWQIQNISALFSSFFVANIAVLITATVTDTCRLNQVRCWLLFTDCRAAALPLVDHAVLIMEQLSKLASSSQPLHTWCSISWYLPLDKTVKADCLPFLCLFVG